MAEAQKHILESIRDIIGNDKGDDEANNDILELTEIIEPGKAKAKPVNLFAEELTPAKAEDADDSTDVLSEIDALLAGGNTGQPDELSADLSAALSFEEPEAKPEVEFKEEAKNMDNNETLISEKSAAGAQAALKNLSQAAQIASRPKIDRAPFKNGDTVEDLVMDMLKPILKDWLDANLPKLVQTIVEKEIKKLIPKE